MKKKILPLILLFILCFSGVLAMQIFMGRLENGAGFTNEKAAEYEELFQNDRYETKEGALVRLKDVKAPIVVVLFWAKYCLPCHAELKELSAFQKKYNHDQIFVLAVNEDPKNQAEAIEFMKRAYDLRVSFIEDADSLISHRYSVENLPTSFIFIHGRLYKRLDEAIDFENEPWEELIKKTKAV